MATYTYNAIMHMFLIECWINSTCVFWWSTVYSDVYFKIATCNWLHFPVYSLVPWPLLISNTHTHTHEVKPLSRYLQETTPEWRLRFVYYILLSFYMPLLLYVAWYNMTLLTFCDEHTHTATPTRIHTHSGLKWPTTGHVSLLVEGVSRASTLLWVMITQMNCKATSTLVSTHSNQACRVVLAFLRCCPLPNCME